MPSTRYSPAHFSRSVDLTLHRLRVGHGIPDSAAPIARIIERVTADSFQQRERDRMREEAAAVQQRYSNQALELCVSRIPAGMPKQASAEPIAATALLGGVACRGVPCSPALLSQMATHLRDHGVAALRRLPIARLLTILDQASLLWLDPSYEKRSLAIEAIHRWTGFSREMVIHSIDLEMRSSRRLDLWRTLWTELGNPRVLDGRAWCPSGESPCLAFGPSLIGAVFSSNIPALPHLTYMRGLAVKSPVLGKVASNEPIFAAQYIDTLIELCPELAPALAALWFPGGSQELESALLSQADCVIAYGSDSALQGLSRAIPPESRRLLHGHRMGFGAVDHRGLQDPELAKQMAYDFAVFDGQACLAPVVYFVETELSGAEALAQAVGRELQALATWLPARTMRPEDRAAREHKVQQWEVQAVFGSEALRVVRAPGRALHWAGLVSEGEYIPQQLGDRLFHIHCIRSLDDVVPHVRPFSRYLQNVALSATGPAREQLAVRLAGLGVSRVNRPGRMATPSMMWHHDGRLCIAELVRWADIA